MLLEWNVLFISKEKRILDNLYNNNNIADCSDMRNTYHQEPKKTFNLRTSNVHVCANDLLGNKMGLRWYVYIVIKEEK